MSGITYYPQEEHHCPSTPGGERVNSSRVCREGGLREGGLREGGLRERVW